MSSAARTSGRCSPPPESGQHLGLRARHAASPSLHRDEAEPQGHARRRLSDLREVAGQDRADPGIAPGRLALRQKHERRAIPGHLHIPRLHDLRDEAQSPAAPANGAPSKESRTP
jgi:hypothetical protein